MATMNVSIPDPLKAWVEAQAASGRYANASDYIRDLIRRDQERMSQDETLQRLITEGLISGPPESVDLPAFQARMRAKHAATSK